MKLPRLVELPQPLLHGRPVVRIAGQSVRHEFHVLVGGEWKMDRTDASGSTRQSNGASSYRSTSISLAILSFVAGSANVSNRDRVAVDVAPPAYFGRGLDLEPRGRDVQIMPLTRPEHRVVRAETDG